MVEAVKLPAYLDAAHLSPSHMPSHLCGNALFSPQIQPINGPLGRLQRPHVTVTSSRLDPERQPPLTLTYVLPRLCQPPLLSHFGASPISWTAPARVPVLTVTHPLLTHFVPPILHHPLQSPDVRVDQDA